VAFPFLFFIVWTGTGLVQLFVHSPIPRPPLSPRLGGRPFLPHIFFFFSPVATPSCAAFRFFLAFPPFWLNNFPAASLHPRYLPTFGGSANLFTHAVISRRKLGVAERFLSPSVFATTRRWLPRPVPPLWPSHSRPIDLSEALPPPLLAVVPRMSCRGQGNKRRNLEMTLNSPGNHVVEQKKKNRALNKKKQTENNPRKKKNERNIQKPTPATSN